jgi:predicted enzyme related to lactoylglutathione lyase
MTVLRTEVGLVSADEKLVRFYCAVFGLEALEPRELPIGRIHRLGHGEAIIKIMVPTDTPAPGGFPADRFWDRVGLQYVTLWVRELDEVAARCAGEGGTVAMAPFELRPGVRTMIVHDPDGNVLEVMEDTSQ